MAAPPVLPPIHAGLRNASSHAQRPLPSSSARYVSRRRISAAKPLDYKRHTLRTVSLQDNAAAPSLAPSHSASRSNTKDLCIRMLVEAHPIAFTEFFNLTNDATHHGLDLYGDDQLLHLAQRCLTQAEEGERANNLVSAFDARCTLAEAFAVRHAMQLALQQRLHALEIAKRMTDNSIVCQASLAAAELCEQCDELANAQALAQQVIELTVQDSSCCSFSPLAQQFLSRTALARTQQLVTGTNSDPEDAAETDVQLQLALSSAEASQDTTCRRKAQLSAAQLAEGQGSPTSAIRYYEAYLDLLTDGPPDGAGQSQACLGLARCHEVLDQLDLARTYLTQLVELSQHQGDHKVAAETCSLLGGLATRQLDYAAAVKWSAQAVVEARHVDGADGLVSRVRARCGAAMAATMSHDLQRLLISNTPQDVQAIVAWCSTRHPFSDSVAIADRSVSHVDITAITGSGKAA